MKRALPILCVLLLIPAAVWGVRKFLLKPEEAIRRDLQQLAVLISARPKGNIAGMTNVERILGYFVEPLDIKIETAGRTAEATTLEEIRTAILGTRAALSSVLIEIPGVEVRISPDGQTATALTTILIDLNNDKHAVVQEMKIDLRKPGKRWLISGMQTTKSMQ